MDILRSFIRRLLVQAIVSGTVMVGLQVAVRFGPEVFPPLRTVPIDGTALESAERTGTAVPAAAVASADGFAQDWTHANVKAGRFPVWQEREATVVAIPHRQLAARKSGTVPGDVMLFDRCWPDCESRDPLLAFNRRPMTTPSPTAAPEVLDDIAVSSVPDAAGFDARNDGAASSEGIVTAAARGGLSMARRLVGTAGSVVGW